MNITRNQGVAGIVIVLSIGTLTLLKNNSEPTIEYKTVITTPVETTEVVTFEESIPEEIMVTFENEESSEITHYTEDGIFIVPYPDYENFSDAFSHAREVLGDSSGNSNLKIFLWRGDKYNTETLKQSNVEDSVKVETIEIVEPDTTVKDSTK